MSYIGKETQIVIGGRVFTLSRLTRSVLKDFSEWVYSHTENPLKLAAAHIKDFPEEFQPVLLQKAWEDAKARMDIEGPEVREAMNTVAGSNKLFQLLLAKNHPELTEDEVFGLSQEYFAEEVERLAKKLHEQKPELTPEEAHELAMTEVIARGTFRLSLPAMPGD